MAEPDEPNGPPEYEEPKPYVDPVFGPDDPVCTWPLRCCPFSVDTECATCPYKREYW